jgi:hypothetical protein
MMSIEQNGQCKDIVNVNEMVLIQSIILSKKLTISAYTKKDIEIHPKIKKCKFVPDLNSMNLQVSLLKGLVILQGFIKGKLICDGSIIDTITLPFQHELICEEVCPGDEYKTTPPILEGVLEPQCIYEERGCGIIILKAIFSLQLTVIREKIGKVSVTILGDINEDRCNNEHFKVNSPVCEKNHIEYVEPECCDCHEKKPKSLLGNYMSYD